MKEKVKILRQLINSFSPADKDRILEIIRLAMEINLLAALE